MLKHITALCLASVQSSSTVNDLVKLNPLRLAEMHRRPCDQIVSAENQKSICRQDGLWHPKQCDQSECWCVNALNGTPDYSTKTTDMISDICAEECLGGQWTRWFNTDNPLSPTSELRKGDLETLDRARLESRRVCAHPLSFKVSLEDGTNVSDSPDTINYILTGPTMGITCFNGEQENKCKDYQVKFCCPLNSVCHWSNWSDWSQCSSSCGGKGVTHRARRPLFKPFHMEECPGRDYEVEECGSDHCCPVDCTWSEWTPWSECSSGCHGGDRRRTRQLDSESSCGGECPGRSEQVEQCNSDCGIFGVWNGDGCVCDAGWMGQCCRDPDQSNTGDDIQADDSGFDMEVGFRRSSLGLESGTSSAAQNSVCQKLMDQTPPANGKLDCQRHRLTATIACEVTCDKGFDFAERPAHKYFCHPSGVTFTAPPGKAMDWPDCTRRHEPRGIKNEVWFQYVLEENIGNCRDNLIALKKAFKSADTNWLASSFLPGFRYFSRVRLECGNKDDMLQLNEKLEEVAISTGDTNWARSLGTDQSVGVLMDKKEMKKHDRKDRKKLRKAEKRADKKSTKNRTRRNSDGNKVLINLRLIQFPTDYFTDDFSEYLSESKDRLIANLKNDMTLIQNGKLLGKLERVKMNQPVQEERCLHGEIKRDDICVACPSGSFHVRNECVLCPVDSYQPKSGQISCLTCNGAGLGAKLC